MKQNLFEISKEEKKRIIYLHETRTSKHYLTEQVTTVETQTMIACGTGDLQQVKTLNGQSVTVDNNVAHTICDNLKKKYPYEYGIYSPNHTDSRSAASSRKVQQTGPTPRHTPNFSQTKPANTTQTQTKTTSQQKKCYFKDDVTSQSFAIWFLKNYKDYATKIGLTQKTDKCSTIMGKAYNLVIGENIFNAATAGEYYYKMMNPNKSKSNLAKVDQSAYAANVDATTVSVGYDPSGKKVTTQKTYIDPSKLTGPQPGMDTDEIIDIISGIIDLVPVIGTVVSVGIDIVHALSYIYRSSTETNPENKLLYMIQGIAGMGTSLAPEIGNVFNISLKRFLTKFFGWWTELINIVTNMVSKKQISQSFLTWLKTGGVYQKFLFVLSYVIKKLGISALVDKVKTEVSNQLQKVQNAIKDVPGLGWLVNAINAFIRYLQPEPEHIQGIDIVLQNAGVVGKLRQFMEG